jgi:parallel beta-helix repeat protein
MFSVQLVNSQEAVFNDDFDAGLVQWNNFGYPTPATFQDPSFEDGWGYSTEGDGWHQSGSWSKQLIDISNGVIVEFRVKQEAGDVWDMFYIIGVGRLQSGYREDYWPYYFGIGVNGHNPDGSPEGTDDIYYVVYVNETFGREYREDAANDHQFHIFKIVYDGSTNMVEFYKDDNFVVALEAGPRPYDELPLLIVGRDYSNTNYLDWIRVLPLQKPEHDLAVTLETPSLLKLGESGLINATVWNRGLNNETNIEFSLFINGTIASSILIPELLTEESYTLSYSWTSNVEGVYNVTAYANPVPDENITANNLKTGFVRVLILPEILIVNDDDGGNWIRRTSLQEFESALSSLGYDYWVWNESSEGNPPSDFLVKFKLVIWTCGDFWGWAVDQFDAATLQSYLAQGGNILLEGEDIGYNHDADEFMVNVAHATYQVDNTGASGLTVTDPTHPVTFNLPTSFTWLIDPPYDDGVTPTNGGTEVIRYTGTAWTAVTVFGENVGGKMVYYAFPLYCLPEPHRTTLAINSINWLLGIRYEHELGVKLEAPDILQLGKTAVLNATIYNYGLTNESDVKLQLFINNTEVYSVVIPELLNGSFYTLSYSWTPTVEGLYNVSVYAPPIPGEEIITNNLATKNVKVMAVKVYQLSHVPRRMHGDENYIYYTAENGGTYRINKITGVEEFFSQYGHDLIWVEGNYVYVGEGYELSGSSTNDIYKYDKNGNIIWHVHPTYEGPWGGATFQFGVGKYYIYAVAGPYAYGAISKEDGSIVWVSQGGVTRYPDMVIADLKNDVVIECGYWSPNTIQRISKVDGHIIWQRKGPTEEMGECTEPVDITDDAIWIRWYKGEYPNHYFYALAKWDRNTGALIQAFPELPYGMMWHVGPEGSLTFDYPYEAGNALVWNYQTNELCKVNTNTWEIYWSTDIGYPMEYCAERLFIDKEFIYLGDKYNPRIIYQYQWTVKRVWTGTVYIRADGSIDPSDAPIITHDNVTYTLTGDIRSNADGIIVQRDNIIIDGDGHVIQGAGSGKGIDLTDRKGIKIQNLEIITFSYGIYLYRFSENNTIVVNNLINNSYGIEIEADDNNVVSNIITASNVTGIWIVALSDHNNIIGNHVTNSTNGIVIEGSYNNRIFGNSITKNNCGIDLRGSYSYDNVIYSNNITNNNYGIYSWGSASNNLIYHNNFVNNTGPAYNSQSSMNVWDDGYPSGGNYWSDYTGLDLYSGPYQNETGSDCLGDMPNVIDANNQDRYPLMAPFKAFEAGVWDRIAYDVDVLSNSTVSVFKFNVDQKSISFNVTGDEGTIGFCRVAIPKNLLWVDDGWTILVDSQLVTDYTKFEDENYTYLYFTYAHSTKTVTIRGTHVIPEYPLTLILALFMATTLIAVVVLKTKRKRQFP